MCRLSFSLLIMVVPVSASAGILVVNTNPKVSVPIQVDGIDRGVTPLTWPGCSKGRHQVTIDHPDYSAKPITVVCKAAGLTRATINLKSQRWTLKLSSSPSKLNVFVNEQKVCVTPCSHSGKGKQNLKIDMRSPDNLLVSLGMSSTRRIRISSGIEKAVKISIPHGFIALKRATDLGQLKINGTVTLGEEAIAIPTGRYQIVLDYDSKTRDPSRVPSWVSRKISVKRNKLIRIAPPLLRRVRPASINLSAPAQWVSVFVDGNRLTTKRLRLRPGQVELTAKLPNSFYKADWLTKTIRLTEGKRHLIVPPVVQRLPHGAVVLSEQSEYGTIKLAESSQLDTSIQSPLLSANKDGEVYLKPGQYEARLVDVPVAQRASWNTKKFTIKDGETVAIKPPNFALAPATLMVKLSPSDAQVVANNTILGPVPVEGLELPAVATRLEFRKSGYKPKRVRANLKPGKPLQLEPIVLRRLGMTDNVPGGLATTLMSGAVLAAGVGSVMYAGQLRSEYTGLWETGGNRARQEELYEQHQSIYPVAMGLISVGTLGATWVGYRLFKAPAVGIDD